MSLAKVRSLDWFKWPSLGAPHARNASGPHLIHIQQLEDRLDDLLPPLRRRLPAAPAELLEGAFQREALALQVHVGHAKLQGLSHLQLLLLQTGPGPRQQALLFKAHVHKGTEGGDGGDPTGDLCAQLEALQWQPCTT